MHSAFNDYVYNITHDYRHNKNVHCLHKHLLKSIQGIAAFLPVCVRLCIFKFSDRAKTFPHPGKGQGKGFSPVCTRMWFTSLYFALNGLLSRAHSSQKQTWLLCSGPPTCSTETCVTNSCMVLKVLLQHFLGLLSCSGSIHLQMSSCLMHCCLM